MEPLSITASILTVLGVAGKAGSGLQKLFPLADAPNELASLVNEIAEFQCLLKRVHDAVSPIETSNLDTCGALGNVRPIVACARQDIQELDELVEYRLKRSEDLDKKGRPKISRGAWLMKQEKLKNVRQRLSDWLLGLNVALSSAGISQAYVEVKQPHFSDWLKEHYRHLHQQQNLSMLLHIQDVFISTEERASQDIARIEHKIDKLPTLLESRLVLASLRPASEGLQDSSAVTDLDEGTVGNHGPQLETVLPNPSASAPPVSQNALYIRAAVRTNKCPKFCRCQCHVRTQISTPRWMKSIFGSFFGSFTGLPLLGPRPCNYSRCRQAGVSSTQVLYMFPGWFVKRAIAFSATWRDLSGPGASWTFRMPRPIGDYRIIWQYVEHGLVSKVRKFLEMQVASPYDVDARGVTLLHYAIVQSELDVCHLLLEFGADLYVPDNTGRSAARIALQCHWRDRGASTAAWNWQSLVPDMDDFLEENRLTLLHQMILGLARGNLAEQLDRDDSLIDSADSQGWTPLHCATYQNNIEAVRIILERGAKPGIADREGHTPLHLAAHDGHLECAKALLGKGALVMACDQFGHSPLHLAAFSHESSSSYALADLLIQKGADIYAVNYNNRTALHKASYHDNLGVARALLSRGANIEGCNKEGRTPIMDGICNSAVQTVELLLQEGARLDHVDIFGYNVLHLAALAGNYHTLNVLLNANLEGIDPRACDQWGSTPLDCFNHGRAHCMLFSVEGITEEDERELFIALLARAGYSEVEEVDEDDSGDGDMDGQSGYEEHSEDGNTDDQNDCGEGSASENGIAGSRQDTDSEPDAFVDAEEMLLSQAS